MPPSSGSIQRQAGGREGSSRATTGKRSWPHPYRPYYANGLRCWRGDPVVETPCRGRTVLRLSMVRMQAAGCQTVSLKIEVRRASLKEYGRFFRSIRDRLAHVSLDRSSLAPVVGLIEIRYESPNKGLAARSLGHRKPSGRFGSTLVDMPGVPRKETGNDRVRLRSCADRAVGEIEPGILRGPNRLSARGMEASIRRSAMLESRSSECGRPQRYDVGIPCSVC